MTKDNPTHASEPQNEQSKVQPTPADEPSSQPAENASTPITSVIDSMPPHKKPKRKKRDLLWLWITLGVVLLLAIAATTILLVAKSGADTAAKNYTAAAKTYLSDVYDSAVGSSEKPSDIIDDIEGAQVPVLEESFLSGLSNNYKDAEQLRDDISAAVNKLTDEMKGYQVVYDVRQDIADLDDEAEDAIYDMYYAETEAEVETILVQFGDMINKQIVIIEEAKLPKDLAETQTDIVNATKVCRDAWSGLVSAYRAENQAAFEKSYDDYVDCVDDVSDATEEFEDYYNDLSAKFRASAKPIRELNNNIR